MKNPHVREWSRNDSASTDVMGFFGGCARAWPGLDLARKAAHDLTTRENTDFQLPALLGFGEPKLQRWM
jgi:hypothetical protein